MHRWLGPRKEWSASWDACALESEAAGTRAGTLHAARVAHYCAWRTGSSSLFDTLTQKLKQIVYRHSEALRHDDTCTQTEQNARLLVTVAGTN